MFGRSKAEKNKKLLKAIAENNYETILKAIQAGADVNAKDKNGQTAFMLAYTQIHKVVDNSLNSLSMLHSKTSSVYDMTETHIADHNPFYQAVIERSIETHNQVKAQIRARAEEQLSGALKNRFKVIKAMIDAGADVNVKGENGQTALMDAAARGEENIFRALIEANTNINDRNANGDTALMLAAKYGQVELVKILLEKGADINAVNNQGDSALILATSRKCFNTTKTLLDCGAEVNLIDARGDTALLKAVLTGEQMLVEVLIAAGADVNAKNNVGQSPLTVATEKNKTVIVDDLIAAKADLEITDSRGNTPLILAAERNCLKTVQKFVAKGANINARNTHGDTAVILASYHGCKDTIAFLVTHGADIKATNNDGYSALSNLLKDDKRHYVIIDLLQKQLEKQHTQEAAKDHVLERTINIGRGDKLKESFNFNTRTRTQAYYSGSTRSWTPEVTESFDEIANASPVLRDAFDKYRAAGGTLGEEVLIPHKKLRSHKR